ncbi:amine oxidase [Mycena epipterygia]|nr:amine oxidase [Mycena epipterygia]
MKNYTGIIAARALYNQSVDFVIIEAGDELGGRLKSYQFGNKTVEAGGDSIEGTQTGSGPSNPIFELAQKHSIETQFTDFVHSITTFDSSGQVNFIDIVNSAASDFTNLTVAAGARVQKNQTDLNARAGYSLSGAKRADDSHRKAAEYYQFDGGYGQSPEQTSWVAASWNSNATFNLFSDEELLSIDQRGFKAIVQEEAKQFVAPGQMFLNSIVKTISYSSRGVNATLANGTSFTGYYAICTFSLGVLQNDDVKFQPPLPDYKLEAIQSMKMATHVKIFFHFPKKFWFDTEIALYADKERGRYPIWESLDHDKYFPGSGIIYVTVAGDFAERVEALPDSQVQEEALAVLKSMYPKISIPKPLDIWFRHWHSDPLYRDSYPNWPASFRSEYHDNLVANVGRLYFAGDHTDKLYYGFVHGAYYSGFDAGTAVANCVSNGGCADMSHVDVVQNTRPY